MLLAFVTKPPFFVALSWPVGQDLIGPAFGLFSDPITIRVKLRFLNFILFLDFYLYYDKTP
jgi:hypothetical protein